MNQQRRVKFKITANGIFGLEKASDLVLNKILIDRVEKTQNFDDFYSMNYIGKWPSAG